MATDPGRDPTERSGPRAPREPRDYRPDLRPMLILVVLLVLVVVGWILLSPLILPAPAATAR
jgi:hypothetical protein